MGDASVSLKRRQQDPILKLSGPIVLRAVGALPAHLITVDRLCPHPGCGFSTASSWKPNLSQGWICLLKGE